MFDGIKVGGGNLIPSILLHIFVEPESYTGLDEEAKRSLKKALILILRETLLFVLAITTKWGLLAKQLRR